MNQQQPQAGDILLVLRPLPDDVPVANRLRRLLKFAFRGLDLRCISAREVSSAAAAAGLPQELAAAPEVISGALTAPTSASGRPGGKKRAATLAASREDVS